LDTHPAGLSRVYRLPGSGPVQRRRPPPKRRPVAITRYERAREVWAGSFGMEMPTASELEWRAMLR
jgi:hypothetical protein